MAVGAGRILQVGDLLAAPELGLSVLVPGDLGRRVRSARVVEMPHPGAWLGRDVLALTAGVAWGPSSSDGAFDAGEYALEAHDAGAAGLVFALGVVRAQPPPELAEACARLGLPLLGLPAHVAPVEVEEHVRAVTTDVEGYLLRRRLWFQNDLLAALADDSPLQSVMTRLAHLVRGTAALYDESGRLLACVGEGPVRLIWGELEGRERREQHLEIGRYRVLAGPVVMRGSGYWLALASRTHSAIDDVGEPLLDTTRRMLSAMRGARSLSRAQEDARARGILTLLSVDVTPERVPRLWTRLRSYRFTPQQPVRALVATREPRAGEGARQRADRLEQLHESAHLAGLPVVLADDRDDEGAPRLLALAADDPALGDWSRDVASTHVVGVSEPLTDLARAPAAFRDAAAAARVGRVRLFPGGALPGPESIGGSAVAVGEGVVVRFEDVDLATWLRSSRPASALRARAARELRGIAGNADLKETLVAYLAGGLDVGQTARRLFLHPNSVRYRLRRAQEVLGAPVTDPAMLPNLFLALHDEIAAVAAVHDGRGPAGGGPGAAE